MRLGIDLGGTNLKLGIFLDSGETVRFEQIPVDRFDQDEGLWESVLDACKQFQAGSPVQSVGLSVKGLVDAHGVLCDDIGLAGLFRGQNLKSALENRFKLPACVVNDARAYAWGEYTFGAGRGATVLLTVTLGTGFGCAIVAHGKPWIANDPTGGILGGHISIDRNGPKCLCGNKGCLENYCSATALREMVNAIGYAAPDGRDLLASFFSDVAAGRTENDRNNREIMSECRTLFDRWCDDLATGLVSLIHTTGADTVVVGGGLSESSDLFIPIVRRHVHERAWTWPRGTSRIESAQLGNRSAALGAAFFPELT